MTGAGEARGRCVHGGSRPGHSDLGSEQCTETNLSGHEPWVKTANFDGRERIRRREGPRHHGSCGRGFISAGSPWAAPAPRCIRLGERRGRDRRSASRTVRERGRRWRIGESRKIERSSQRRCAGCTVDERVRRWVDRICFNFTNQNAGVRPPKLLQKL